MSLSLNDVLENTPPPKLKTQKTKIKKTGSIDQQLKHKPWSQPSPSSPPLAAPSPKQEPNNQEDSEHIPHQPLWLQFLQSEDSPLKTVSPAHQWVKNCQISPKLRIPIPAFLLHKDE